jgi:hypothetical protein
MGGHSGPPPTYTGLEAKIRKFLPEDHHMALGYIGMFTGLFLINKMIPSKPAPAAPAVASTGADGDMPSADSAEFGEWIGKEGNMEKMFGMAA